MRDRAISVTQMYGTADLGLIAYESLAPGGGVNEGMILEEGVLLEIVRPAPATPCPPAKSAEAGLHHSTRTYPLTPFPPAVPPPGSPGNSPSAPPIVPI